VINRLSNLKSTFEATDKPGTILESQRNQDMIENLDELIDQVKRKTILKGRASQKHNGGEPRSVSFGDQSVSIIERVSKLKKQFEDNILISDTELENKTAMEKMFSNMDDRIARLSIVPESFELVKPVEVPKFRSTKIDPAIFKLGILPDDRRVSFDAHLVDPISLPDLTPLDTLVDLGHSVAESDTLDRQVSFLTDMKEKTDSMIQNPKITSDSPVGQQLSTLQNEVSNFMDGNKSMDTVISNIQPLLEEIETDRQSSLKRKCSLRAESIHPKFARPSVELIDPEKIEKLQSLLQPGRKSTKAALSKTTTAILDILGDIEIGETSDSALQIELNELQEELNECVEENKPVSVIRKSLAKCRDFVAKAEESNETAQIPETSNLDKIDSILRVSQAAIKSKKSTKKTLTNTSEKILDALKEIEDDEMLKKADNLEFKAKLDEVREELVECLEENKPVPSLRKSLAKSLRLRDEIEELQSKIIDSSDSSITRESSTEDIDRLETALCRTTVNAVKTMPKATLLDESQKLLSVMDTIDDNVFGGTGNNSELKETIGKLKSELESNIEENKRVVDIRKTLQKTASILESIKDLQAERQSTKRRSTLTEDQARLSKRARNSIAVTKYRQSVNSPEPPRLDQKLREFQSEMNGGKSMVIVRDQILESVTSALVNDHFTGSAEKQLQSRLTQLKNDLEESFTSNLTAPKLRRTITQNLNSVLEVMDEQPTPNEHKPKLERHVSFSSFPDIVKPERREFDQDGSKKSIKPEYRVSFTGKTKTYELTPQTSFTNESFDMNLQIKDRVDNLVKQISSSNVIGTDLINEIDSMPSDTLEGQMSILTLLSSNLTSSIEKFVHQKVEKFPGTTLQTKADLLKEVESVSGELRRAVSMTEVIFRVLEHVQQIQQDGIHIRAAVDEIRNEVRNLKQMSSCNSDAVSKSVSMVTHPGSSLMSDVDEEKVIGFALRNKVTDERAWASPNKKIPENMKIIGKIVETGDDGNRKKKWVTVPDL